MNSTSHDNGSAAANGATANTLGSRIREAREHRGLSHEELALNMGIEVASLMAWEADERPPRANRLNMLCGMLDVTLGWLLDGGEDGSPTVRDLALDEMRGELDRLSQQLNALVTTVDSMRERLG